MKKKILFFVFFLAVAGLAHGQNIAATTSVLSSAIEDISGGKIEVATLVPSGSCPGHFDLKTRDLETIERSGILFAHGFEEYLEKIKSAVKREGFKPVIIEIGGSWLVPVHQKELYRKLSKALSDKFPDHRDFFEKRMEKTEEEIDRTDAEIKKISEEKKVKGAAAICNSHIKELLEYIGFKVAATYGRKEDLTPAEVKNLVKLCREKNVRLVVDNLQAGPDTGKVIAMETDIPHLAVSNFPDVFPGTPTLRQTLLENAKRILSVYESAQNKAD